MRKAGNMKKLGFDKWIRGGLTINTGRGDFSVRVKTDTGIP